MAVSRVFGGTKLGTGGLARAYGAAAAAALDAAAVRAVRRTRRVRLRHGYAETASVQALLAAWNLTPVDARFAGEVALELDLPAARATDFVEELRERTAGRATAELVEAPHS